MEKLHSPIRGTARDGNIITLIDDEGTPWLAYREAAGEEGEREPLRFDSPTASVRVDDPPERAPDLPQEELVQLLRQGETITEIT